MTDLEALHEAENMALFNIGSNYLVMPLEQAVAAMMLFKKARKYEYSYDNSNKTHHIGGELPQIGIDIIASDVYAEGLINGARKRG